MKGSQRLRHKIDSAEQLQSVVRTMKALAAANIRDCDRAVAALAEFGRAMELGFQAVLTLHPNLLSDERGRTARRLGVVVFGSDEGMCGQVNDDVVEHALSDLTRRSFANGPPKIHVVGDRPAAKLERDGQFPPERVQATPQSLVSIAGAVRELLFGLESWRVQEAVNEIILFYAKRGAGAFFQATRLRLLPVDRSWLASLTSRKWPSRREPMLGLTPRQIFRRLLRQHLYISLYRALAESMASENASRLASMEGAERNIDERLEELERTYRRNRQTVITEELLDIVSGFEAQESS